MEITDFWAKSKLNSSFCSVINTNRLMNFLIGAFLIMESRHNPKWSILSLLPLFLYCMVGVLCKNFLVHANKLDKAELFSVSST